MADLAAVILAAGAGKRLGGVAKALLARRDGSTFLASIVASARAAGGLVETIVVVGPPHGDAIAAHARELNCRIVVNPQPERGMASSVALGFGALGHGDVEAAWLWPVDHPDVLPRTLQQLVAQRGAHDVARPVCRGRGGHPPLVGRQLWPQLAACFDVEGGARAVFAEADVIDVEVDDLGTVRDVDTPDDLEAR
jgi:CTP:molybdopterin cytidylyltransferase MocA